MDGQVLVDTSQNRASVTLERSLYPLDVIYGASYIFIDRCFVLLDAPDETHVRVDLTARDELDEAALRELAGDFGNEMLTQVWRQETVRQNQSVVEIVTARALAGAQAQLEQAPAEVAVGGGELDGGDLGDLGDAFDDPLGIAVPWEEKYGKKEPK